VVSERNLEESSHGLALMDSERILGEVLMDSERNLDELAMMDSEQNERR
jgi:hypothetical protein